MKPLACCALLLLFPAATENASAQARRSGPTGPDTLGMAQRTFLAADRNQDGFLDAEEVAAAAIPARDFAASDLDGDGRLSSDEFLAYYGDLLERSGRSVGRNLRREIRRSDAAGTAQAGAGQAGRTGRATAARRLSPEIDVAEQLERARRALDRARRSDRGKGASPLRVADGESGERLRAARAILDAREAERAPLADALPAAPARVGFETVRRAHEGLERARGELAEAELRRRRK